MKWRVEVEPVMKHGERDPDRKIAVILRSNEQTGHVREITLGQFAPDSDVAGYARTVANAISDTYIAGLSDGYDRSLKLLGNLANVPKGRDLM